MFGLVIAFTSISLFNSLLQYQRETVCSTENSSFSPEIYELKSCSDSNTVATTTKIATTTATDSAITTTPTTTAATATASSNRIAVCLSVSHLYSVCRLLFFCTGHRANLASLQLSSGFVGAR